MRHQENQQSESHLQCAHNLNAYFIGLNKNGQFQLMCHTKCLELNPPNVTSLETFKKQFEEIQQEFKEIDDLKDDFIKLINFLQNNQNQNFVSNTIHCLDLQKQSLEKNQAFSELKQKEILDIFQKMEGQSYQNCINDIKKSLKEIPRDFFLTLQSMLKVIQNILSFFKQNSILYDTQLFEKQIRKEKQEILSFDYNKLNEIKCEKHKLNFSLIDLEEKSQKRALCPSCDYSSGFSSSLQKYIEDNFDAFQTYNNQIIVKKQERINAFLEILESHSRISKSYSNKLLQILNESQTCYSVDNEEKLQAFCEKIFSFKSLNEVTQYFKFEKQLYSKLVEFYQQFSKEMENFYDQKKKQVEVQESQIFFSKKKKNTDELKLISIEINYKFLILIFNKLIQFICLEDQKNKKEKDLEFDIKYYCFQLEKEKFALSYNQFVQIYQIQKEKIQIQNQHQLKDGQKVVKMLFINTKNYYFAIVDQKIITVLMDNNQNETFGKIDNSSETYCDAKGTDTFLICARQNAKNIIVNLTIFPLNQKNSSIKLELKKNFRNFQIFSQKDKKLQLLLFFDNELQLLTFNSNSKLGTQAIKLVIDNQNIYHCPFNKSQIVVFSDERIDIFQIFEQSQRKLRSTFSPKILYNKFSQKKQCETNNFTIYEDYVLCQNQTDINVFVLSKLPKIEEQK